MNYFYIHGGLHKTGTTSLQYALKDNAADLFKRGILYPKIGVPDMHAGQHNLAWELSRYRRFDPALGDWNALFAEIENFDGSVVISSEDFETTILKPALWREIANKLTRLGFQLVFVIYLRDPISYLESIYLQHLKSGSSEEYLSVFNKVCHSKSINHDEREFCFDYLGIQKVWSTLPDVRLVFRNYQYLVNDSVINDFEDFLDIKGVLTQSLANNPNKNLRPSIQNSLKFFTRNRTWSWFKQQSPQKIYHVLDLLITHNQFKLVTPLKMREMLNEKLADSDSFLRSIPHAHAEILAVDSNKSAKLNRNSDAVTLLNIQRVFSFETYLFLLNLSRLFEDSVFPKDLSGLNPEMLTKIDEWWRWVKFTD